MWLSMLAKCNECQNYGHIAIHCPGEQQVTVEACFKYLSKHYGSDAIEINVDKMCDDLYKLQEIETAHLFRRRPKGNCKMDIVLDKKEGKILKEICKEVILIIVGWRTADNLIFKK